jgi:integrase
VALNAEQINAALVRMKVLWTPEPLSQVNPTPISRDDFHKLLQAGQDKWKAWLLCGLNFCMHLDEVCQIKWSEIDLKRGTYASIRTKTRRERISQAATLWPETIAAFQAIPRRGQSPYVFTSSHGSQFNRNTRRNDFADLRRVAKVTTLSNKGNPIYIGEGIRGRTKKGSRPCGSGGLGRGSAGAAESARP